MASTNLLQWNPNASNQENDAAYLADSQRAGGATDPSIFEAELANKLFYQATTYLTALFQAFAAKGFTTSDSNLNTLTAQCANFLTTADVLPAVQVLAYSTPLTLNAALANGFYIKAMTGALVISAINNLTSGQLIALYFQQDGTGGRTVTYPAIVVGAAQPDPAPNAVSLQLFGYDVTTGLLRAAGPLVSNNEVYAPNLLTAGSFTLAAPGTSGQVLTNVGGIFVPRATATTAAVTSVVTGSRSFGVTYQNTSGGVLYVTGYGLTHGSTVGSTEARVGASYPSTTVWANTENATTDNCACGFSFMVPANWYYEVVANSLTNGAGSAVYAVGVWAETVVS